MASKKVTIDFEKMYHTTINYFKNLTNDLIIAYSVLGVGIVVLIVALVL